MAAAWDGAEKLRECDDGEVRGRERLMGAEDGRCWGKEYNEELRLVHKSRNCDKDAMLTFSIDF